MLPPGSRAGPGSGSRRRPTRPVCARDVAATAPADAATAASRAPLPRSVGFYDHCAHAPRSFSSGTYIDKKCPFTSDVTIRGRILTGARLVWAGARCSCTAAVTSAKLLCNAARQARCARRR
jgi:hypothetical protein